MIQQVTTPFFLVETTHRILSAAINAVGQANGARHGDQIMVEPVGVTHDSDGWPMQRWQVTYLGAPS